MANSQLIVPALTVESVREVIRAIPKVDAQWKENIILRVIMDVVARTLGVEWLGDNILGPAAKRKPSSDFLTIDLTSARGLSLKAQRLIAFCDDLINLQNVPGYRDRIESLKTARDNRIESAFTELEIAGILYQYGIQFAFLPEVANAGRQPDFDIILSNGDVVKADAKCKREDGAISTDGVIDAFQTATKQLPKDSPGAILIKVPQAWMENPQRQTALKDIASAFLKGTRRIVSIVYFCSLVSFGNNRTRADYLLAETLNPDHRFANRNWAILKGRPRPTTKDGNAPHWISLMKIIEDEMLGV